MTTHAITTTQGKSVLASMAGRYNVEPTKLMETLKNTAFKGATTEQMMALCIVADQYHLNPFTKEIYAFPDKSGGIVPVVGIDGWLRIINDHAQFDGLEIEDGDGKCTCTIYRKDRAHAIKATEYLSECKRNTAPWSSHPMRMLRHKAIIQCARIAFGFSVRDPDDVDPVQQYQPPRPIVAVVDDNPDPALMPADEPQAGDAEAFETTIAQPPASAEREKLLGELAKVKEYKIITFKKCLKAHGLTLETYEQSDDATLALIAEDCQ